MKFQKLTIMYWSPTGATRACAQMLGNALAESLSRAGLLDIPEAVTMDITTPRARLDNVLFGPDELLVIGSPTYAGKLPNKILPFYQEKLHGNQTVAVPLVTFGNRSFDNSLAELSATLLSNSFIPAAGAGLVTRHAFAQIGTGHPDEADFSALRGFAAQVAEKLAGAESISDIAAVSVPGDARAPYYIPKGLDGKPAKFLKAKPLTKQDLCNQCGICAAACPMGSISPDDPSLVEGICIKCQACVRLCPTGAKYFDNEAFLSHKAYLEKYQAEPKQNAFFM